MVSVFEGHDSCQRLPDLLHADAQSLDLLPLVDGYQLLEIMASFPGPGGHNLDLDLRAEVDVVCSLSEPVEPSTLKGLMTRKHRSHSAHTVELRAMAGMVYQSNHIVPEPAVLASSSNAYGEDSDVAHFDFILICPVSPGLHCRPTRRYLIARQLKDALGPKLKVHAMVNLKPIFWSQQRAFFVGVLAKPQEVHECGRLALVKRAP